MKPQKPLVPQTAIRDEDIDHWKQMLALTAEDEKALSACLKWIEPELEEIVASFIYHQAEFPEMARIIADANSLEEIKALQKSYIMELFGGQYGAAYVHRRLENSLVHKRIGIEPRYHLAAMRLLRELLSDAIKAWVAPGTAPMAIRALNKLTFFDTQIVVDTYIRDLLAEVDAAREEAEFYAESLEKRVAERTRELEEMARKDSLTGLYNQLAFRETLQREISRAIRSSSPLSLAYFDLDGFKAVNDTRGHQKGDDILKTFGGVLQETIRNIDTPCRYGGDEFCTILSGANSDDAAIVCQRLMAEFSKRCPGITLSAGVAQTGPDIFDSVEVLIERADALMYEAKRSDGFQVATAGPRGPETPTGQSES